MLKLLAVSLLLNVGLSQALFVVPSFTKKHLMKLQNYPPTNSEIYHIMKRIKTKARDNRTNNSIFYSRNDNVGTLETKLRVAVSLNKCEQITSGRNKGDKSCKLNCSDFAQGVVSSTFKPGVNEPQDCHYSANCWLEIYIGNQRGEWTIFHLHNVDMINKTKCKAVPDKVDNNTKKDVTANPWCKNTNSTKARRKRAPCSGDTSKTVTCTPDPCVDVSPVNRSVCNFEKDFCDWSRAPGSTFNFKRVKGPTDMAGKTGPTADRHGSLTGYYIYADASDDMGQIATLRSPNFPAGNYCVEFYYHMFGVNFEGSLQLMMYTSKTAPQSVFTKTSSIGNKWNRFLANLNTNTLGKENFHFEFKARIGKSYTSDIAIDDISITKGRCLK